MEMNPVTTSQTPAIPDYSVARERARAVLMEVVTRAAVRVESLYRMAASGLAAKRHAARESGLSVEGRVNLGPKKSLVLVHCHGRRYLIASAGDTMAPILEVLPVASQKAAVARKPSQARSTAERAQPKGRAE
jgi:hypothetical protein